MKRARDARAKRAKEEKRQKKEALKSSRGSPLSDHLFDPATIAAAKAEYSASSPFPHLVVPNLCNPDRARLIEHEARTGLKADFKETDLFKVYQTPDLGNLGLGKAQEQEGETAGEEADPEDRSAFEEGGTTAAAAHWVAPQLEALRDAIYSERFRDLVSQLSGCGPLEPIADCSCNAYVAGGHLLCHDDVINTRRVSYIIYLNDPESSWEASDGGALELYPLSGAGVGHPDTTPAKNILPCFNQMVLFTVVPGESFHAVQEVFAPDKPRLSISGWFHGKEPPPGMELATRAQLQGPNADATEALAPWCTFEGEADGDDDEKNCADNEETSADNKVEADEDEDDEDDLPPVFLSAADVEYLKEFMNPDYLNLAVLGQLRERWLDPEEGSAVQLDEFLNPPWAAKVGAATRASDAREGLGTQGRLRSGEEDEEENASREITAAAATRAEALKSVLSPVSYSAGVAQGWEACGPVHKQRFLRFNPSAATATATATGPASAGCGEKESGPLLERVRVRLLGSAPFRRWLKQVTRLKATRGRSLCRRFRPGLDYTVAHAGTLVAARPVAAQKNNKTAATTMAASLKKRGAAAGAGGDGNGGSDNEEEEEEFIGVLDANLCFVDDGSSSNESEEPGRKACSGGGAAAVSKERSELWHAWDGGEVGGFECYVEAETDPTGDGQGGAGVEGAPEVYQTTASAREHGEGVAPPKTRKMVKRSDQGVGKDGDDDEGGDEGESDEDDSDAEEAGGTLLSVQGRFNCLNLVVRDPGVMRFVKYVSYSAPGSRWDVAVEFEVE